MEHASAALGRQGVANRLVQGACGIVAHAADLLLVDHVVVEDQPVKSTVELRPNWVEER